MRYALVVNDTVQETREYPQEPEGDLKIGPDGNPMLRPIREERPTIDPATHKLSNAQYIINPNFVLEKFIPLPLTANDLQDRVDTARRSDIGDMGSPLVHLAIAVQALLNGNTTISAKTQNVIGRLIQAHADNPDV